MGVWDHMARKNMSHIDAIATSVVLKAELGVRVFTQQESRVGSSGSNVLLFFRW